MRSAGLRLHVSDPSDLLRSEDARARIDLVAPPLARLEKAEPVALRYLTPTLAAAALGHALRAELARAGGMDAPPVGAAAEGPARIARLAPEMADAAQRALEEGARGLAAYARKRAPDDAARRAMAAHALQLGRLEAAARAGYVDKRIGDAEWPEDVEDVLAMLERAPRGELRAYAEGALLLDVKGRKDARLERDDARGLVLRLLADRLQHPDAAPPDELGVLLARHGLLWRVPSAPILRHATFPALQAWFAAERARLAAPPAPPERAPAWVRKRASAPRPPPQEGKAEPKPKPAQKKPAKKPAPRAKDPALSAKARRPQLPRKAAFRDEEDADEPERPRRPARPDWRRGSQWRRDRGL